MSNEKQVNIDLFKDLVKKGFNCKQIAKELGISNQLFGIKMKRILGIYPSVYIAKERKKNGKT